MKLVVVVFAALAVLVTIPGAVAGAPSAATPVPAPLNPDFVEYVRKKASGEQVQTESYGGYTPGLIPPPVSITIANPREAKAEAALPLPATYDLRSLNRVTAIRDQDVGNCGSCWDFAAFGSLESCIMPDERRDFSENNLKNLAGYDYGCCAGGGQLMATAYFARWDGPVNESDDPYNSRSCTSPLGATAQKHVQKVIFLPDKTGPLDNDAIKQAVMAYGAVWVTMLWDGNYYNSATASFYYTGYSAINHAVCIVGWDDNYPTSKFLAPPPGNGAYIIRNSFGAGFGQGGYFYVSYYDSRCALGGYYGNTVFVAPEPTDNYDHIYQYDKLGWIGSFGFPPSNTGWFANVFTATSSDPLVAVSFYTVALNSDYEIYAYLDPVSGPTNPAGPAICKVGTLPEAGYNTVRLDTGVPLAVGQTFSVVVKLTSPGVEYPICAERCFQYYSSGATANPGESYVSPEGTTWTDATTIYPNTNVCLKAFTSSSMPQTVRRVKPDSPYNGPGNDWDHAYHTIAQAMSATYWGNEIWVAQGTYVEKVQLRRFVAMKGGYSGVGEERDPSKYVTVIDAGSTAVGSYTVTGSDGGTVDGFTIRGGYAGIYCIVTSPTISGNTITGNTLCGVYCCQRAAPTITNNLLMGNGTGIAALSASPTMAWNTIVGNNGWSGIYSDNSSCTVSNNIVAFNRVGILKSMYDGSPSLTCNDVWGNPTGDYSPISLAHPTDISSDPLFANRSGGDYHLLAGSPCIDAGSNSSEPATDFDGYPRRLDGNGDGLAVSDIGCHEFINSVSAAGAKAMVDGAAVGVGSLISTALFGDRFYIEEANRVCGIGVLGAAPTGKQLTVKGTMTTVDGERLVQSFSVKEGASTPIPNPFFLNGNALGGGPFGLQQSVKDWRQVKVGDSWEKTLFSYGGANNIGLLIETTGAVTAKGEGHFYLDGGGVFDDNSGISNGARVDWPFAADSMPGTGDFIAITAISSCAISDGQVVRLLRPVSADSWSKLN